MGQGFFSMVRRHWREPAFWRWWWTTRASRTVRVAAALVLLALLLAGGVFAAARLTSANAGVRQVDVVTYVTTVRQTVTVQKQGKVVRKLVPVVKRVAGRSTTVTRTQTRTQTLPLTQVQTVYRTVPVSVPGKERTVQVHDTVVHQVTVTVQKPQVVIVKTVTVHDTVTVTAPAATP